MSNTDADTAISVLNKLITQELAAASAAYRDGDRTLYKSSSIRYHAYLAAKGEIKKGARRCRGGKGCGESVPAAA